MMLRNHERCGTAGAALPSGLRIKFKRRTKVKLMLVLMCVILGISYSALSETVTQTFPTSAGPVRITPIYHASTLIEAGGKTIYLDPAKPANLAGRPKADLILITDIHPDHMDPTSIAAVSQAGTEILAAPAVVTTVKAARPAIEPFEAEAARGALNGAG